MPDRVRAGDLRNVVTISRIDENRDAQGGVTRSLRALAENLRASIVRLDGAQDVDGSLVATEYDHLVTLREPDAEVRTGDFVTFGNRELQIDAIGVPEGRRGWWMELRCTERRAPG